MRRNMKTAAWVAVFALVVVACAEGELGLSQTPETPVAETTTTPVTEPDTTETPAVEETTAPEPRWASSVAEACADFGHFYGTIAEIASRTYAVGATDSNTFSLQSKPWRAGGGYRVDVGFGGVLEGLFPYGIPSGSSEVLHPRHKSDEIWTEDRGEFEEAWCEILDNLQRQLRLGNNLPVTDNVLAALWWVNVKIMSDWISDSRSDTYTKVFVDLDSGAVVLYLKVSNTIPRTWIEYDPKSHIVEIVGNGTTLEEAYADFCANAKTRLGPTIAGNCTMP